MAMTHLGYRPDLAKRTLAIVMAGGSGTRLGELTRWHAKPALPFGGHYRNIDFSLSNCINSGIRQIGVLTQYKAHSLIQHLQQGWSFLRPELGEFVEVWPAQQRRGQRWYDGTADAVYQNLDVIMEHAPTHVLVLAGDHVYKMDYRPMLDAHTASRADVTVGCVEVPLAEASGFGIMGIDASGRVREFAEKPVRPKSVPGKPDVALGSMGIYVFSREFLCEALMSDAGQPSSSHDFGRDVLPELVRSHRIMVHRFADDRGGAAYWRDVGTVESYWQANLDLLADAPKLDLLDSGWPIWTYQAPRAPARLARDGKATRSIVAGGALVAGHVDNSVLSVDCTIEPGSTVESSVLLPNVRVGRRCRLRNVVVDAGCEIPDDTVIGEDAVDDALSYDVAPGGVVLVSARRLGRQTGTRSAGAHPRAAA